MTATAPSQCSAASSQANSAAACAARPQREVDRLGRVAGRAGEPVVERQRRDLRRRRATLLDRRRRPGVQPLPARAAQARVERLRGRARG